MQSFEMTDRRGKEAPPHRDDDGYDFIPYEDLPDGVCFSRTFARNVQHRISSKESSKSLRHEVEASSEQKNVRTEARKVKFVGSFPVQSNHQQERAEIVRTQLQNLKNSPPQKPVLLVVSLSGIKVCCPQGQTTFSSHALRRISYATCEPSARLLAFLARPPQAPLFQQVCHVFRTTTSEQAEEINALIGNAFRIAFAMQSPMTPSMSPPMPSMTSIPMPSTTPLMTSIPTPSMTQPEEADPDSSVYSAPLDERPPSDRTDLNGLGSDLNESEDSQYCDISEDFCPSADPDQSDVHRSDAQWSDGHQSHGQRSDAQWSDRSDVHRYVNDRSEDTAIRSQLHVISCEVHSDRESSASQPRRNVQSSPQSRMWKPISSPSNPDLIEKSTLPHGSGSSGFSSGGEGSSPGITPPPVRATPTTMRASSPVEAIDPSDFINQPWFQPNMPRTRSLELLVREPIGSFVVRPSTSRTESLALSVRVPIDFVSTGIAHYLIVRAPKGFKIKGYPKQFPSVSALITHHSIMPEMLPMPLALNRYNARRKPRADMAEDDYLDPDRDYEIIMRLREGLTFE